MNKSFSNSYKDAGVDVTAGYKAVELMKKHVARTMIPGVCDSIGGFGGMFELDLTNVKNPVLVSGTDGVGTKLKLAFLADKHDTIGIDCVAMCVNDIICCGAKPQIFLDYVAVGKNYPEKIEQIVSGVAEGCVQAGCAIVGGETAEMPGLYGEDEYDLAGFAVGIVDKSKIVDKNNVVAGDLLIGLPSSGIHSNGFSLVRKALDVENRNLNEYFDELGCTLIEELLKPTKIYVKPVLEVMEQITVKSVSHVTGGGFYENLPRAIPNDFSVVIDKSTFEIPAIFNMIARLGNVCERDMFNTFNMGIGMVLIVGKNDAGKTIAILQQNGIDARMIGFVKDGGDGVEFC